MIKPIAVRRVAPEGGDSEVGASEIGASEVGASEVGASEVGALGSNGTSMVSLLLTDPLDRPKSARMFAVPKIRRADSGVLSTN
jgi:hypothetical protein